MDERTKKKLEENTRLLYSNTRNLSKAHEMRESL